ncbi:ABC transporter permease [Rothia uropygialis]|uniref:ABC transporter permease n=1 Tax=Kocuria sp. 36 TaxID=1415402 RepID=UPI001EE919DF|nr:ABC transporter permease [Kocuria sp. 36]
MSTSELPSGSTSSVRRPENPQKRRPPAATMIRVPYGLIISGLVVLIALAWAVLPSVFVTENPLLGDPDIRLSPPGTQHWFGTDHLGRDVFSRVVQGAGASLGTTAIAVLIAFFVGTLLGLLAGTAGSIVDTVLMRVVDVLQSVPSLLLSLAVVAALGAGTVNIAVAVALASIPSFARLMRGEVLRWRNSLFIEAASMSGIRTPEILARHILPHAIGPVFALAAIEFGAAILAISALSFLGFGTQPPNPEWGLLISEGRDYLASAWWLTVIPGLVIAAVVVSVNRISHALQTRRPS